MKSIYKLLFVTLFTLIYGGQSIDAQVKFGINFNISNPIGSFDDNVTKMPLGFSFNGLFPVSKIKGMYLGGEVGVSMYANDDYELQAGANNTMIEIDEEDCFLNYNLVGRYIPMENKMLQPYLEARIGGQSYFSTRIAEENDEDVFDNKTTFHGTAFNLGLGSGILTKIRSNIFIDLGVSYNNGTKTAYRSLETIDSRFDKKLSAGIQKSKTNHFNYRLGILFGF